MTASPGALAHPTGGSPDIDADDEPSLRGVVIAGLVCIVAFFGGFLGWSLFAELGSAVIAPGVVVVDSHRKTVQHLEGGILRELLVREGDLVRAGQPVALLDTTQAEAQLSQFVNQQLAVRARLARLRAEQNNQRKLAFPSDLVAAAPDAHVAEIIDVQARLFDARWSAYDGAIAVLNNRIEQLRKDIAGAEAQLAADTERLALYEEERKNVAFLLERGYERRPRMLELQRTVAELKGSQGELRNIIARSREAITGAQLEIKNTTEIRLAEIAKDLEEAQRQEAQLTDQIRAAQDVRDRREIVSPQDGVVVDPRLVTPGGVITPGQPFMDIVPVDDELIIETRVHPDDIDVIHEGLPAEVRLSVFKRTRAPVVDGVVDFVSADMLSDPRTGDAYFKVRVKLSRESLAQWKGVSLSPGMPTEVMISTGKRLAIDYFAAPITERMRRAFREE